MKFVSDFVKKIDLLIFLPAVLLSSFGLLMIFSLSFESDISIFLKQLSSVFLSILVFLVISRINFKTITQYTPLLYTVLLALLLVTFFFGNEVRGSVRWIDLGFIRIQASEMAKPVVALCLATFLASNPPKNIKNLLISLLLVLLPAAFVIQQPDLGSGVVIIMIWAFLVFLAGISAPYLLGSFLAAVLALPILWNFLQDYQKMRILSFLNPNLDPLGSSYNVVQALIAFGSGQLVGRGLGRGTQTHLDFLPAESTDFIFAFIGEELGILGIGIVLFIFALLVYRLIRIAVSVESIGASLFSFSAAFIIFIQFFINAGVNVGIIPVTGITLPLVSFGGSSMISTFLILGLANSIVNTYLKEGFDPVFNG